MMGYQEGEQERGLRRIKHRIIFYNRGCQYVADSQTPDPCQSGRHPLVRLYKREDLQNQD